MRYNNNSTLIGISSGPSMGYSPAVGHPGRMAYQQPVVGAPSYNHAGASWGAPALPAPSNCRTVGGFAYPNPPYPFMGLDLLGMNVSGQAPNNNSYGSFTMAAYR